MEKKAQKDKQCEQAVYQVGGRAARDRHAPPCSPPLRLFEFLDV